MNKKLKQMTKDIIHVLNQDKCLYSDPLTEFLLSLHQDMDFDMAKQKLQEAQEMIKTDFFLCANEETIVSNSRLAIFSIYCRIHESVDISTIAEKMGMPANDAEDWIVDLIQSGKLSGARINSSGNKKSVFFPKEDTEVYSQVMEKTKNMGFRLFLLQANAGTIVDKKNSAKVTGIAPMIAQHLIH
jgi:translation initiation factor 3 subunit E